MAGVAFGLGIDMQGGFTGGDLIIVTTAAGAEYLLVINAAQGQLGPGRRPG